MEQEQQIPATPLPKSQPVIVKKSSNASLVGAIIFLALVIASAVIFFAMRDKNIAILPTSTPTQTAPTPSPTTLPAVTNIVEELQTLSLEKMKDLSFPGFTLQYPKTWAVKEARTELMANLTLTKDGNEIKINQGPMGGNRCVFDGTMPDGPANDYRDAKFVDINVGEITLRRLIPTDLKPGKATYSFCSNSASSKTSFGIPTVFGVITFTLPTNDATTLSEMDNIVKSLKSTP